MSSWSRHQDHGRKQNQLEALKESEADSVLSDPLDHLFESHKYSRIYSRQTHICCAERVNLLPCDESFESTMEGSDDISGHPH
jgi:hypothetical protein